MATTTRRIGPLVSGAAAVMMAAFGGASRVAAQRPAGGGKAGSFCPAAETVGRTMGFEVRIVPAETVTFGDAHACTYQGTGVADNAFVTVSVQRADPEEDPVVEVPKAAKRLLGERVEVEPIDVGEGGFAYGARLRSEAAARKGGRAFHAEVWAMERADLKDKKSAVIALLRQVVK